MKNILTIQVEEQDNIGRLFREKLEFAELIPSASLRNELMSKTARKEFLRFNPTRVNIYYLAALLAVAAAALILITGNNRHEEQAPKPSQTDTNKISVVPVVPAIADQVISQGQLKVNLSDSLAAANSEVSRNDSSSPANGTSTADQRALNITPVREMATVKGIFTGQGGDGKELKGMITVPGLIEAQVTEGCAPLKIKFGCSNGSYESYHWSFGNGGNSDLKQPEWTFTAEGDYRIALVVRRTDGINLASFTNIRVHGKPVARFEIRQNEDGQGDETKFINYSLNASRFRWSFGDGSGSEIFEPVYTYAKAGNYTVQLIATSDDGCSDTLITENVYDGRNYYIRFPNAFIPNPGGPTGGVYSIRSDESAQVFHPAFSGVSEYRLKVFSRTGVLMFETTDVNTGWDGYFKGQLCEPGVYVWKVMGTYVNGETFISSGDLTLLKAER